MVKQLSQRIQEIQPKYEEAKRLYKGLQKLSLIDGLYFKNAHQMVGQPQDAFNTLERYFEESRLPISPKYSDLAVDGLTKILEMTLQGLNIIKFQFQLQLEHTLKGYEQKLDALGKKFYELMVERAVGNLLEAGEYPMRRRLSEAAAFNKQDTTTQGLNVIKLLAAAFNKRLPEDTKKYLDLVGELAVATYISQDDYKPFQAIIDEYQGILIKLTDLSEKVKNTLDSTNITTILLRNLGNDGFEQGMSINRLILDLKIMQNGGFLDIQEAKP